MKKILLATAVAATTLFSACEKTAGTGSLKSDVDTVSYALGLSFSIPEPDLKQGLMQIGSDSAYTKEFQLGLKDGILAGDDKKQMAYFAGLQRGMMLGQREIKGLERQLFANDSTAHLNMDLLFAGLKAGAEQKGILMTDSTGKPLDPQTLNVLLNEMMQSIYVKNMEVKFGEYKKQNAEFMAQVAKREGVKELGNGVYYKELTAGDGEIAAQGETLEMTYEGRLIDGTVFDKTPEGKTIQFPVGVGQVVRGFDAAISKMPVGSEWEVYMPADQAYGEMQRDQIKPYSTLIFKIKAVKVIKNK